MSVGLQNTSVLPADFGAKSFDQAITRLMPNGQAVLFGLTSMLKSERAVNTEHGFFTKTMLFPQLTTSASATSSDTTLTVTSTANITAGMTLRAQSTGEIVIVNQVLSSTQVLVARGIGTIAAGSIGSGVNLYQVGNAFEQGSVRPNPVAINPVRITNYTQIFRNSWALTDTLRNVLTIAGDDNVTENRMDAAAFHAADIEKALIFGQRYLGQRNGQPFSTMDGLINITSTLSYYPPSYASANVTTLGSTTNFTQFENALDPCLNQATDPKTANERILLVGSQARRVINGIGRLNGQYQLMDGQTSWGLQFDTFKLSRGTFRLIEHPLFNSNADWAKMAVAVDLNTFRVAYLGDRKTQHKLLNASGEAASDNGIDAQGGTFTTEMTCVIKNPPANAVLYNFTAAAAG